MQSKEKRKVAPDVPIVRITVVAVIKQIKAKVVTNNC